MVDENGIRVMDLIDETEVRWSGEMVGKKLHEPPGPNGRCTNLLFRDLVLAENGGPEERLMF